MHEASIIQFRGSPIKLLIDNAALYRYERDGGTIADFATRSTYAAINMFRAACQRSDVQSVAPDALANAVDLDQLRREVFIQLVLSGVLVSPDADDTEATDDTGEDEEEIERLGEQPTEYLS